MISKLSRPLRTNNTRPQSSCILGSQLRLLGFGLILASFTSLTIAQSKIVVIPLAGDDLEPLANVVTVAKKRGEFTDPIAAMASIDDASPDNPYLLAIAPGVFELSGQLVIKNNVSIAGSGLSGSVSSDTSDSSAALVVGTESTTILMQDLTIVNDQDSGANVTGLWVGERRLARLSNVQIMAQGLNNVTGISGSRIEMRGSSSFATSSGGSAVGVQVRKAPNFPVNYARIYDSGIGASAPDANTRSLTIDDGTNVSIYGSRLSSSSVVLDASGAGDILISHSSISASIASSRATCSFVFHYDGLEVSGSALLDDCTRDEP